LVSVDAGAVIAALGLLVVLGQGDSSPARAKWSRTLPPDRRSSDLRRHRPDILEERPAEPAARDVRFYATPSELGQLSVEPGRDRQADRPACWSSPVEGSGDSEQFVHAFKPFAFRASVHQYLRLCAAVVAMRDAGSAPVLPREGIASAGVSRGDGHACRRSAMAVTQAHTEWSFRSSATLATRLLGALSLGGVGAVHLQQYEYLYSDIPTIGPLFLLNFLGATALSLGLVAPVERLLGRSGGIAVVLLALGGIGLAATAFTFLLVSERTPVFGFMEPGYDPAAIMAARVSELVTVGMLGSFLLIRRFGKGSVARW
jgi:hypothetical protein